MSGPTESVNNIHDNRQGGSTYSPRSTLAPQKRKIGDGGESFVTRKQVPRTSQGSEKMPRNHGNGKASHDAAFSIEKILSPTSNCKDAEHASVWSPGAVKITKKTGRSPSPPAPDGKTLMTNFLDKSEGEERAEVVNGADSMPADKWYNTLLWQQHQQLYQQQLAAASAFYHHHHTQQFQQHVLADPTHHMQQPHIGPVPVPIPGSGVPPSFCPGMPGKVHPFNCHCAEQIHEQPYFLLTPAGYSIPSPFEPDHHHSSPRYCRRRKARTVFNEYQIRGLEARFVHQQYLSTHERVELANVLFLTEGQVKTWFQNRRMKQKKLTRDSVHPFDTDADDEDNDKLEFDEEDEVDDDLDNEDLAKKSRSDDTKDKYKFKK